MGKNANQIATFADLNSIGYRVPNTTKEVVIYKDLSDMEYMSSSDLYKMKGITSNIDSMDNNKCIAWEIIPGITGQDPSKNNNGVTCPVQCKVISANQLESTIQFLYSYVNPSTGDPSYYRVGDITLSSDGVCQVLANPYINGVTKDWLSITIHYPEEVRIAFSTNEFNKTEPVINTDFGNSTILWMDVRDERTYNQTLQNLEKVTITVS